MYQAGLKQVMEFQQQNPVNKQILSGYADAIAEFYRKTKEK